MPFQPCTGIAQFTVEQTLRGERVLNILHYENSVSGWDPVTLLAAANRLKTKWLNASGVQPSQSSQITIGRVIGRDLTTAAGAEVVSTVADGTGSDGAAALESSLAAVVTLGSGLAGRSYRGRTYIGGIAVSNIGADPNHLSGGSASALATRLEFTCKDGLPADETHVILSRSNNLMLRAVGIGTEVMIYTCNSRLDNQRRRMPRV